MFALAHLCHISPAESLDMRVFDFAVLIHGIDEYAAAQQSQPAG